VPGYFAADGNATQTSVSTGDKWRAHLAPDKPGRWNCEVAIVAGRHAAVADDAARSTSAILHSSGNFTVATGGSVPEARFSKQSLMRRGAPKRMNNTAVARSALECGVMPYFRNSRSHGLRALLSRIAYGDDVCLVPEYSHRPAPETGASR
jgi:hypothetical protein